MAIAEKTAILNLKQTKITFIFCIFNIQFTLYFLSKHFQSIFINIFYISWNKRHIDSKKKCI